jgi:hypothetical protein
MAAQPGFKFTRDKDLAYAVNLVETVTWLAGKPDYWRTCARPYRLSVY